MPDGALFVDVGRGSRLDEDALLRECASGRLRAALDVFATEPVDPDSALWATPGLRIFSHCSTVLSRALDNVAALFRENLTRLPAGVTTSSTNVAGIADPSKE